MTRGLRVGDVYYWLGHDRLLLADDLSGALGSGAVVWLACGIRRGPHVSDPYHVVRKSELVRIGRL